MNKEFLKNPYMGTDGEKFRKEFITYLEEIIEAGKWRCGNDFPFTRYLQGGKTAIIEIIDEIKNV